MTTHAVIFGDGAQTLRTVPTTADGEPMILTAAQARIVDLRLGEDASDFIIEAKAAATIDTTTDTTTADVGPGSGEKHKIAVGTPAGFIEGRSYALVGVDGRKQEIVVDRTDATAVYTQSEVRYFFATGATLRGFELSFVFPALEADDEIALDQHISWPYAIDWFFDAGTPDPDPTRARDQIYFRRTPSAVLARPADIENLDNTIGRLNTRDNKVEKALIQAHRDFYRMVRARRIDPDSYLFGDTGRDWVTYRAAEILRRGLETDRDDELADMYKRTHGGIWNDLGGFGEISVQKSNDRATHDITESVNWRLS